MLKRFLLKAGNELVFLFYEQVRFPLLNGRCQYAGSAYTENIFPCESFYKKNYWRPLHFCTGSLMPCRLAPLYEQSHTTTWACHHYIFD